LKFCSVAQVEVEVGGKVDGKVDGKLDGILLLPAAAIGRILGCAEVDGKVDGRVDGDGQVG
jgi:hypothetical protein